MQKKAKNCLEIGKKERVAEAARSQDVRKSESAEHQRRKGGNGPIIG